MRILFLQKRLLFPTDTGGKIRTLNVVRHLARWHDLTYLSNIQEAEQEYAPAMRELGLTLETIPWRETPRSSTRFYFELGRNLLSPYPYNVAKDFDMRLRGRAERLLRAEAFDLIVCDFVQMARNAIGLPGPPRILFQHNVEAEIFERHAQRDPGWVRRRYMALQARKMRRFEGRAGRQFDAAIAISERDKQQFKRRYGWDHVETIDTAVDLEYFHPSEVAETPDRLLFVGSMDWLPNQDGVAHFVRAIWPAIRRARPSATFQVVGRNPPSAIRDLGRVDGVTIVGTVPDVRPYLDQAALFVVPLLVGGGTRLKIYEAMAMKKAIVSTTLGAEGLPVTPAEHLAIADDPASFAQSILRLLANPDDRTALAAAALDLVQSQFGAETVARQFDAICRSVALRRPQPGTRPTIATHTASST